MRASQSLRDKKPKVRASWYPFSWPSLISLDFLATFAACLKTHGAEEPFCEAPTQLREHLAATGQTSLLVLWAAATTIPILAFSRSSPLQRGPSPPSKSPLASCINCWGSEPWEAAANKSLVLFTGGGDEKRRIFVFWGRWKRAQGNVCLTPQHASSSFLVHFLKAPPKRSFMNTKWSQCLRLLQKKGR